MILQVISILFMVGSCSTIILTNRNVIAHQNPLIGQTDSMTYKEQLQAAKEYYPFEKWREYFFPDKDDPESEGMKQYTQENCDKAKSVFDTLIDKLAALGQNANKQEKVGLFKTAVLALNKLDNEIDGLIETGEREDLCELFDQITIAARLNPQDYGDGQGIADEWRNW